MVVLLVWRMMYQAWLYYKNPRAWCIYTIGYQVHLYFWSSIRDILYQELQYAQGSYPSKGHCCLAPFCSCILLGQTANYLLFFLLHPVLTDSATCLDSFDYLAMTHFYAPPGPLKLYLAMYLGSLLAKRQVFLHFRSKDPCPKIILGIFHLEVQHDQQSCVYITVASSPCQDDGSRLEASSLARISLQRHSSR